LGRRGKTATRAGKNTNKKLTKREEGSHEDGRRGGKPDPKNQKKTRRERESSPWGHVKRSRLTKGGNGGRLQKKGPPKRKRKKKRNNRETHERLNYKTKKNPVRKNTKK